MSDTFQPMTNGAEKPDEKGVLKWIGSKNYRRWEKIIRFIESNYPGVFDPDWRFGGRKYGWALRFKKSKSFCTLFPQKNRFKILLVFGAEERKKAGAILSGLSPHTREAYGAAKTFHDGKWLWLDVDGEEVLCDVERLFAVKRKPKPPAGDRKSHRLSGRVMAVHPRAKRTRPAR